MKIYDDKRFSLYRSPLNVLTPPSPSLSLSFSWYSDIQPSLFLYAQAKPFNFLPGNGMSIEIHLSSADKPLLFGGMLRRNLIYDQLVETWQAAQRAIQHQNSSSNMEARASTSSHGEVKSRAGSQREVSVSSHDEAGGDGSDSEND